MSNKNRFRKVIESNGFKMGLYEMTLSVFGTFYSGAVIGADDRILYDFKGVGFDEAYLDLSTFLNSLKN